MEMVMVVLLICVFNTGKAGVQWAEEQILSAQSSAMAEEHSISVLLPSPIYGSPSS